MKVLLDMNLFPRWVAALREADVAAEHWSSLGARDAPDTDIMAYARANDYIVLTHDLDFGAILAATQGNKPSVVQIRMDDISPEAIGNLVINALRQLADYLDAGALVTVGPQRTRLRVLPLHLDS